MSFIFKKLDHLMKTRPLITNICLSGGLTLAGDFISQTCIEKRKPGKDYDIKRSLRMMSLVTCFTSPIMYWWFTKSMPRLINLTLPKLFGPNFKRIFIDKPIGNVFTMVTVNQMFWSFAINPIFLLINGYLTYGSWGSSFQYIKNKYWRLVIANGSYWPFVNIINFWLIPLRYRVLYSNAFSFIWSIYICWLANSPVHKLHQQKLFLQGSECENKLDLEEVLVGIHPPGSVNFVTGDAPPISL